MKFSEESLLHADKIKTAKQNKTNRITFIIINYMCLILSGFSNIKYHQAPSYLHSKRENRLLYFDLNLDQL
jgi:hypothetical protein